MKKADTVEPKECTPLTGSRKIYWPPWLAFTGPAMLAAVGYIDPGNWATDIAGGARAGYSILSIVFISSIIAIFLQILSARLGIATGKDLAQLSRSAWPGWAIPAWLVAELAIIATDLAEILGSALALKLLFNLPLLAGVFVTAADVFILLFLDSSGMRQLERIIISLLFIVACAFGYELILAKPPMADILYGYLPTHRLISSPELVYLSVGVIGATVMPHNLYLHSHLILKRWPFKDKSKVASYASFATFISLTGAMFLNSALVILAASVFHRSGQFEVREITEAYHLLTPLLNNHLAAVVFAVALLASGKSSTITGTIAGQVVMSGFLNLKVSPRVRRLITRSFALLPAVLTIAIFGEKYVANLLIASQVFLSLQLPFAMLPLLILTSQKNKMGILVNRNWVAWMGWVCVYLILASNLVLLITLL